MDDETRRRRYAAARACDRRLSGVRPLSLAERIDDLTAAGTLYDLDGPPDSYGGGPVAALESRVATLLGTADAAFFPTGTMAQQAALRCWASRTGSDVVAMHPLAHPELHEDRAYSHVSGLRAVWPTTALRLPTADEVRVHPEPFGTLMLELPLRDAGFVLPTWDSLAAVVAAARSREAVVHFDGARLWESTVHLGRSLSAIADLADSVYVSFYKSLGGHSGAALAGPADLIDQARVWRHRYGGNLFQQWPAALSALLGLERELPRLPSYVAHASVVAAALAAALPMARVCPLPPHTQQFRVWLPYPPKVVNEANLALAEEEKIALFGHWWAEGLLPDMALTEVTVAGPAMEWSGPEIAEAAAAFLKRLP